MLLRVVCDHRAALGFLDRLEETRRLERIFVQEETEARAYRLLRQHADQDFSFVDATSFAVMRAERGPSAIGNHLVLSVELDEPYLTDVGLALSIRENDW